MGSKRITPENPHGLTDKERIFCLEYKTNGRNGTAAARSAGYKQPNEVGSDNLVKAHIQAFLAEILEPDIERVPAIATYLETQEFLTGVMRGSITGTFTTRDGTTQDMPDHGAKLKAVQLLGQMHGWFKPSQAAPKSPGREAFDRSIRELRESIKGG